MNISPIGLISNIYKTQNVSKSSNIFQTNPLQNDTVSFHGVKKQKITIPIEKAKKAADSLNNSTSGHRAIYGSDMFNKDVMNLFAVGVGEYAKEEAIKKHHKPTVLIGGDTRTATQECQSEMIQTLLKSGVNVVSIDKPVPTPVLASYAEKHADDIDISILLTASHNPWEYGGFNLITSDGAIAPTEVTKRVAKHVKTTIDKGFYYQKDLKPSDKPTSIQPFDMYYEELKKSDLINFDNIRNSGISIHYDSLSGTGENYTPLILSKEGIDITQVKTKKNEIKGPEPKAENLFKLSKSVQADPSSLKIGLANDGDADRFGIIDVDGSFINANDVILLTVYHLNKNKGQNGAIVKNQVTTSLIDKYAQAHNIESLTTPVGFKFLAGEIMNKRNNGQDIIVAGEESGGLTVGGHIPEKDGIIAVLLMADLMASEKKPLKEILKDITSDLNVHFASYSGATVLENDKEKEKIMRQMESIYDRAVNQGETDVIPNKEVDVEKTMEHHNRMISYKGDSDGIKLFFTDGSNLLVRKSGTEPKLRVSVEAQGDTDKEAEIICEETRKTIETIIGV